MYIVYVCVYTLPVIRTLHDFNAVLQLQDYNASSTMNLDSRYTAQDEKPVHQFMAVV